MFKMYVQSICYIYYSTLVGPLWQTNVLQHNYDFLWQTESHFSCGSCVTFFFFCEVEKNMFFLSYVDNILDFKSMTPVLRD